jgi:CheY-like chemotaxis protein
VQRRLERELRAFERLGSVAHLTATLVHDINNLLTPIACCSASLEVELASHATAQAMARDIRTAAERAAELTRKTLRWARHEPSRIEAIDIGAVLAEIESLVARVVGAEVEVHVLAPSNLGAASLDRERLEHALLNLAANARDAMPAGGRLTLAARTHSLGEAEAAALENAQRGEYVAVHVSDTGHGMKPEVKERLFEPLFTTKEAGRGTGLGLAAVKRFVDESGGCIGITSAEGLGTTVSLYFPVVGLESAPALSDRATGPRGAETVLVVDDDDGVRRALAAVLESHGYRAAQAASGDDAIAIFRESRPPVDVVVADVVMRGMSGVELAERIRALRPVPVLFTSGHTGARLAQLGLRPGDAATLGKAFTPTALLRALREVLDTPF